MTRTATVVRVDLGPGTVAGFTDRRAGNVAHRRPHLPSELARTRRSIADDLDVDTDGLHLMEQVHGADVAVVTAATEPGAELRAVDALVTREPGRALVVQVADCVPVLVSVPGRAVAAIHAGRRGVEAGVVPTALRTLEDVADGLDDAQAAIGPAIGGCCYEVPPELQQEIVRDHPAAEARTTWGTPSVDLPAAVRAQLRDAGVDVVAGPPGCTHCDPDARWFSHRGDGEAGRQAGVIVMGAQP